MAEPVRKDEPLSSMNWPESPARPDSSSPVVVPSFGAEPPLLPEDTPSRPLGEWPYSDVTEAATTGHETTRLRSAGEAVGAALGAAVNEVREIPGRLQNHMTELKQRFQVISGKGSAELKESASELTEEAERKLSDVVIEARREAAHWKFQARLYARRKPFEFVAGAAAAGFAIGFLLGLGRDV